MGMAAAYFLYALANNGWGYTYHPLFCMLAFMGFWIYREHGWLLADAQRKGEPEKPFAFGQRSALISIGLFGGCMLYGMAMFYATPVCEWSQECKKTQPYVAYLKAHDLHSFGALSEDFHKWAALARLSGADFDTRYNALWMMPAFVLRDAGFAAKNRWITEHVAKGLAQDLNKRRPPVVFVDDRKRFFGTEVNAFLPDFFISVPEFAAAWGHYRYEQTIDRCRAEHPGNPDYAVACRYDVYRRIAEGS